METSPPHKLHIFFLPLMIQGHTIPIINMAKLFAFRGLKSTIVTTSLNAQIHSKTIQNSQNMGMDIGVVVIKFPVLEQPASRVPASDATEKMRKFIESTTALEEQFERLLKEHRPDCLVADAFFTWATDLAAKFEIPRVIFHGTGFFPLCAIMSLLVHEPHEKVESDSEPFTIPNLPDDLKLTRKQLPPYVKRNAESPFAKPYREAKEAELKCFGVVVNSFYELERDYADHYRRVLGRKAWHIGPVSLCDYKIKGNEKMGIDQASIEEHECLKWLDLKKPNSVVYVCFGSMASFCDAQLREIAMGLEASEKQFIWVVKEKDQEGVREEWLPQGFEERIEGKGLIIRGWAPQVAILEHKAVGGFVTHCGWNSMLEAVCAGVPMVTWPMFSEQFYNEKFVTEILGVGVGVGAQEWALVVEDSSVKRKDIEKALNKIMEGEEAEEMRSRASVLKEMAIRALGEGGSSYSDLDAFIEELRLHRREKTACGFQGMKTSCFNFPTK